MPLNYSVKFHTGHGYYAYRVWQNGVYDSGYLKVPDSYWRELGYETPRAAPSCSAAAAEQPPIGGQSPGGAPCMKCGGCREAKKLEQLAVGYAVKAAERRAQMLVDRALGRASKKMNLRQAFDLYQKEGRAGLDAQTRRRDDTSFAAIARHVDVDDVLPEEVDEPLLTMFVNARKGATVHNRAPGGELRELDKPVRHRTIQNEINLLERLVRFARRWESRTGCGPLRYPDEEVMVELRRRLLGEQDSTQVALTEEQLHELLQVAKGWRKHAIVAGVGLRLREENLFGLRGEWIGWADRWLTIPPEFMKKGRSEKARELSIPIPEIVLEHLGAPRLQGFIWTNPATDMPYTRISNLAGLCREAGVPEISEHDLRTTGNTLLHLHGVDHLTRKALMGHATNTGDVTDLYTKVMREKMREAAAVADAILRRALRPAGMKVVDLSARNTG